MTFGYWNCEFSHSKLIQTWNPFILYIYGLNEIDLDKKIWSQNLNSSQVQVGPHFSKESLIYDVVWSTYQKHFKLAEVFYILMERGWDKFI